MSALPEGVHVVLGSQWGDEGKGKLVDVLAGNYSVVARCSGGNNAGHTIKTPEGVTHKLHLVPSGILYPETQCIVGNGVVLHAKSFLEEVAELNEQGCSTDNLVLSDRLHLVFDFHQETDAILEAQRGNAALGTTKRGIGPAYASKISRNGVRLATLVGDWAQFEAQYRALAASHVAQFGTNETDVDAELERHRGYADALRPLVRDTATLLHEHMSAGRSVLVEGANATMLCIDHGTYPFVTSSNPTVGSVCTGLGVPPARIAGVFAIVKAYTTRVGAGPFPTELGDATGDQLREQGAEFGTTTGRPRRCGWIDIVQLRYAHMINGFTHINLTKLDVLTGLEEVRIGVAYTVNGEPVQGYPATLEGLDAVEVTYETMPGWTEPIAPARAFDELPATCQAYVLRVEELLGVPIRWIGNGPGREEMIERC